MIENLLSKLGPVPFSSMSEALRSGSIDAVLQSEIPVAILYPCAHAVGSSVTRAFIGSGVPVLALDHKQKAAGLFSRLATPLLLPGLRTTEEHFVEELLELGRAFRVKPVIFFVDDDDVFLSLKRSKEFTSLFHLPSSGWEVVQPIVDKGLLYRNCQKENFPIPITWFAENTAELEELRTKISFPSIIKPTFSSRFRQEFAVKARRFEEFEPLAEFARKLLGEGLPFVIQEFIEGGQDQLFTYAACSKAGGEVLMGFTGRKVHQFPPDFGTCRLGESVREPELERLGVRFLKMTGYAGISLTEFKKGSDGKFRLIESNTRPGGWPERLAAVCGMNLVLAAYSLAVGRAVVPVTKQPYGLKWANLSEDFYYCVRGYRLLGYGWAHRGVWGWLRDLRGLKTVAFFTWRDPLPSLVRFVGMVRDFSDRERSLR
jgi:D-aspartate ligase